jgi:hypothetical protein
MARRLSLILASLMLNVLIACGGDQTAEYESVIDDILEPITALNGEVGAAIAALGEVDEAEAQTAGGVEALIDLRNAAAALEMEAQTAQDRLGQMDVPGKCRQFHDLMTAAMTEFEQMGAEYAQGADIFGEDRGDELIDIAALERGDAHLLAAQQKLNEAAGGPSEACSG